MPSVYILRCNDGTFYVGSTKDLEKRLLQHQEGKGSVYTRYRLPVTLVYRQDFDSIEEAFAREKQIQGWSHAKRAALIQENPESLPGLSQIH